MMLQRHILAGALLAGLLLGSACRKEGPAQAVPVTFSICGNGTRLTDGTAGAESRVERWTLLLFRDGRLSDAGTSDSDAAIRRTLLSGTYSAWALVNPPDDFDPGDFPDERDWEEARSSLAANAPGRLVMAGRESVTVPAGEDRTQTIGVDRLVCKVGIRRIRVDFTDPLLASRTFRLQALYLTNVCGESRYSRDLQEEELPSQESCWYNRMGWQEGHPALLGDRNLDQPVTRDVPYGTAHVFYCYPNPVPDASDNRSETWSARKTRLVLEARVDGKTCYYPITLPVLERNKTYLIEEVIIRSLGSEDPEREEPGAVDVTFRISTDDWSPVYPVQEIS